MKNNIFTALYLLGLGLGFGYGFSLCASANEGVIDLGTLEITGRARRPLMGYIDTNKRFDAAYKKLILIKLKKVEDKLTMFDEIKNESEVKK